MKRKLWTEERCRKFARKCKSRSEFIKKSRSAYASARKKGILEDICSHMTYLHKPNNFWTKEKATNLALKCKTKTEFREKYPVARTFALQNKFYKNITAHMTRPKVYNFKWSREKIKKEALKYKSRKEFETKNGSAYTIALSNGWMDEACKHMRRIGHKYKRCIYALEFSDNFVYVGLTHDVLERKEGHFRQGPVANHMHKTGLKPKLIQLTNYISVENAINKEGYWQRKYKREGWISLHSRKPGGIGAGKL